MAQEILVAALVAACAVWLGWMGYRFFRPAPGGKACGGGCCDGAEVKKPPTGERVMMVSSDDLRARAKARG